MKIIKLENPNNIYPSALKVAMNYRGISKLILCRRIKNLERTDLDNFFKGYYASVSTEILKEIMVFLDFPFEFLYHDFKPLVTSKGLINV